MEVNKICYICGRSFSLRKNLNKHIKKVHKAIHTVTGKIKCPDNECEFSCGRYGDLRQHVADSHGVHCKIVRLTFANKEEFVIWKYHEEDDRMTSFISTRAPVILKGGEVKSWFTCSTSVCRLPVSVRKSRQISKVVSKTRRNCPAMIEYSECEGSVKVTYYCTHFGHDENISHISTSVQDQIKVEDSNEMDTGDMTELLKTIIFNTCVGFENLTLIELKDETGLALRTLEVRRKDHPVFFPAVAGRIPQNNSIKDINCELATSGSFSSAIEENAVSDPLKIVISTQSWSANLVACGRSAQNVSKVSYLVKGVWQVDKVFFEMLSKLSGYGKLEDGGFLMCSGITNDEYNLVAESDSLYQCNIRCYPGGTTVYEAFDCELVIAITQCTSMLGYPFHRCEPCRLWLRRHLKRKLKSIVSLKQEVDELPENSGQIVNGNRKKSYFSWRQPRTTINSKIKSSKTLLNSRYKLQSFNFRGAWAKQKIEISKLKRELEKAKLEYKYSKVDEEPSNEFIPIVPKIEPKYY